MRPRDENRKAEAREGRDKPDEIEQLRKLLQLMEQFGLSELIIEERDFMVCLRRGIATQGDVRVERRQAVPYSTPTPVGQVGLAAFQAEPPGELHYISSPLTGIFYRRPAPNEPPFVEVGTHVGAGQVVALVEAMKIFNEVFCEVDGIVVEICAQDGQLVHQGDTLMVVRRVKQPS
ncbi:MAG: hypothetical protein GDYSWBUE_001591 [Candidatus Fervidibacterota bacterium]